MAQPRTEIIKVTPEQALKWLQECNKVNRNINQYRVYTYATDMKAGRWKFNGDTIRFSKDGLLLDGQHRLWAVVESGVEVTLMVVWDLDTDVRTTIDTGRPRSTADFFKMIDGTPNAQRIVAMLKVIESVYTSQRAPVSYDVAKERYNTFKEGIDWAIKAFPHGNAKSVDKTPVAAAMAFAYPANKTRAVEFTTKLRTGANVNEGDPALALRNYLLVNLPIKKDDPRMVAIKVMSAFYAYLTKTAMTRLFAKDEGFLHFSQMYPALKKASPLKQLAAQPVAPSIAAKEASEIEIKRVQRTIDAPRPWILQKHKKASGAKL